jgi:anti-anti-sigma factor
MTTPLSLDTSRSDDGNVAVIATGEIDQSNIDGFNRALAAATADAAANSRVTVDLSGVEYIDSAAINALFSHADRIHLIAHSLLMDVLRVSGLTELASVEVRTPLG